MDSEQLNRIEQKVDWLIAWTQRIEPLLKVAESLVTSPTMKLMGRLQRDKAGR